MDGKITDSQISKFSKLINSWQYLLPFLGLPTGDETILKNDHAGSIESQKMYLLIRWRKRNGNKATIRALKMACEKADELELACEIEKVYGSLLVTPTVATPSDASSDLSYIYHTEPVDEVSIISLVY